MDGISVFNNGFVRLDAYMADDISVVNSARVSFGKRTETIGDADFGLIRFLMRSRHGTPFEHNSFRFHVKAPIFVAREWFRHRIGSFNEYSGRYAVMPTEYYVPDPTNMRTQVGKPGSYTFEPIEEAVATEAASLMNECSKEAFLLYESLVERGVAKEVARMILPLGSYTEFYWTVNARALMNFLSLRNDDAAQYEIRVYAEAVESFFSQVMPQTYAAWVDYGRVTP
jgi:thymidylate synthase (FAD)